jgi:glycosyltransferase involved in cell wall biosynthesis
MLNIKTVMNAKINSSLPKKQHRLLLFDLQTGGHHPSYIKQIVEYWCQHQLTDELLVVVSPDFIHLHSDILQSATQNKFNNIKLIAISSEDNKNLRNQTNSFNKIFQEWKIFCKYAEILHPQHSLLMYFDHFQLPLMLGGKPPCSFSGIYFRPTFHYKKFTNYSSHWKDKIRQLRQRLVLSIVLQNQQIQNLFCLDPFAIESIQSLSNRVKVLHLPDPVNTLAYKNVEVEGLKTSLNIERGRKVFLLFGRLDKRKGIHQLLEAILQISPDYAKSICLLLIGEVPINEQEEINKQVQNIDKSLPVQVILRNDFIPECDIPRYFKISDVILAPYQRHVGMSGILLHASAASKPVLASDYGLMGEIVNHYRLGLTIDSTQPDAIANGIVQFVNKNPQDLYDINQAQEFASKHHSHYFADTLIKYCR